MRDEDVRLLQQRGQRLGRVRALTGVSVHVHGGGQLHALDADAEFGESRRELRHRVVARRVVVLGAHQPARANVVQQRPQVFIDAARAEAARHVAKARAPERQRVQDGFAQDDFAAAHHRFGVPHAALGRFQVKMQRRALAQAVGDFAAVELHGLPVPVADREHDRAVQVLVSGFLAQHAELLQPRFQFTARRRGRRHAIAERPIGVADFEPLHRLRMKALAPGQVLHGRRLVQERRVIKVRHDLHQLRVAQAVARRGEDFVRRAHARRDRRRLRRDAEHFQKLLGGVAEGAFLQAHDQLQVVPAAAPGQAVPKILFGRDDERRVAVLVERTLRRQVLAARRELEAVVRAEFFQRHFALDALNEFVGDASHDDSFRWGWASGWPEGVKPGVEDFLRCKTTGRD